MKEIPELLHRKSNVKTRSEDEVDKGGTPDVEVGEEKVKEYCMNHDVFTGTFRNEPHPQGPCSNYNEQLGVCERDEICLKAVEYAGKEAPEK